VRLICAEQDRQMQDFIVEAIREWLEAQRHPAALIRAR